MTVVPWADQKFNNDTMTVYEKLRILTSWQFRLLYSGKEKSRLMGGMDMEKYVVGKMYENLLKLETLMF
jgi:hypothetical protein